ncbi:pterin-4-alpha-carbinolamine dehydratase [Tritonibacter multivorans]|uniref:4a-hydroxytetrahydrobiopterin dehydratase n=1 Tax=Tritonibacter multivorans TaxID=928856 RepID=A0A0P1GHT1_9RHOB|nr:4a-hydroxytetrahydrobiopterin dehydratase [Tritonibacter multivorans]MDA7419296.1 4a-hydroxytetrahydrobiopterin dehydratase [Tritonibacter multivorans]CUH75175.1 pterin-4-alpha-carbinolamine dehydratase [Tritonibacter multivorans]SFD23260.1 4a-hydroxytetrahydrobiopterin dehydratase [Tritonibacter multivorans]
MTTTRCGHDTPTLSRSEAKAFMAARLPDWILSENGQSIERRFDVKGFAKAVYLCNLATYLADKSGHHPDLQLGWGYFSIRYTTHDADNGAGGLSVVDLHAAETFDQAIA